MKTNRISKKQNGFSLIEIMIATTIWSIVALGVGYGVVQVQKSQNNMVSQDMAINLKKNLSSQLKSSGLCQAILAGTNLVYNSSLDFQNMGSGKVNYVNNLLTKTLEDGESKQSIRKANITSIRYRVKSNTGVNAQNSRIVQVGDTQQKVKTLEFEFGIAYLKAGGNEAITEDYTVVEPFSFEMPVYTNMADQFVSCNLDFNMNEMCSSLGFIYDAKTNKCTSNKNLCVFGDLFAMSTLMDVGQADTINKAIAAGGTDSINDSKYKFLKKFLKKQPSEEDLADLNDDPIYENQGIIKVECVTPDSNGGLGCKCEPGFTAREASFFTKDRTVSCGKKCSTDINIKLRTFMCIKCEE
jgi:prepilin-type N-terminal cleavage/methylation domain-containing protein